MISSLDFSKYFQNDFCSRCFQTHVLRGLRMRTIYFTLKSQMNLPKPLSAFLKVNLEQKKDDNGLEQKTDENKNSMTNLQHFFWLLQYRLAILTSPKICVKWLFRIYPRNSLHSLFCFVKHSNKRHISDFKNCCGLFWVSIFTVFISFYQGSIEGRYIWPKLFVFGFSCQSLRRNIRLKMFFLFFIFLYPLFLEFLWYVFRKWQFSVKFT